MNQSHGDPSSANSGVILNDANVEQAKKSAEPGVGGVIALDQDKIKPGSAME